MPMFRFGSTPTSTVPILITNQELNSNGYDLFKGTPGFEDTLTLADNVDGTLTFQPNVAPTGPSARVLWVKQFSGANVMNADIFNNVVTISNLNVTGVASFNFIAGAIGANIPSLIVTGVASFNSVIVGGAATFSSTNGGNIPIQIAQIGPLSANQASITLPITGSLPTVYRNLKITFTGSAYTTATSTAQSVDVTFNGDTTAGHYAYFSLYQGPIGSLTTFSSAAAAALSTSVLPGSGAPTTGPESASAEIIIYDYRDTTIAFKGATFNCVWNYGTNGNSLVWQSGSGQWLVGSTAITSITLTAANPFNVGTLVTLYGIP